MKFAKDEIITSKLLNEESTGFKEITEENKKLKMQLNEVTKELSIQKNERSNHDIKLKNQDEKINQFVTKIEEENEKYETLTHKYNTLKLEYDKIILQKNEESDEKNLKKLMNEIEEIKGKLQNKDNDIKKNENEIEFLKSSIKEKDETIKIYMEKNKMQEENMKKIDLSYEDLLANYQELSNKNKEYKELLKSLQSTDNDGNNSSPKIEITNKICKLENELKRANEEICKLEYEKTDLYEKIESHEVDLHFKNSEIEELNLKFKNELENLNQIIKEKSQEIDNFKEANLKNKNPNENSDLIITEDNDNNILIETIKKLEKEVSDQNNEIQYFRNALKENSKVAINDEISKNDITNKEEEIKDLNEQIKANLELLEQTKVDYESKLITAEVQIKFYKKSYEELVVSSNKTSIFY